MDEGKRQLKTQRWGWDHLDWCILNCLILSFPDLGILLGRTIASGEGVWIIKKLLRFQRSLDGSINFYFILKTIRSIT